MSVLSKGHTFATGDQVTATNLNALVDNATFAAGAVDDSTIALSGGQLIVKGGGITPAKLSTGRPSWDANGRLTVGADVYMGNNAQPLLEFRMSAGALGPLHTFYSSGTEIARVRFDNGPMELNMADTRAIRFSGSDGTRGEVTTTGLNSCAIGATTPSTGAFTTVSASTSVTTPLVTNAGTLALSATGANIITASTNGVERVRISAAGNVGIGNANTGGASGTFRLGLPLTGSVTSSGMLQTTEIQSDVTTAASVFTSQPSTAAAAFTLPSLSHFVVSQGAFGAGSAVTTQTGFVVPSNMTGATNNYGFRGVLAAAAGRYNLYMDGTAQNYLAGNLGIGSGKTVPAYALDVNGTVNATDFRGTVGATTPSTGAFTTLSSTTGANFATSSGNVGIGTTNQFGGGAGVVGIANAGTVPASNPTAGGILYVEGGALKYRGSSGTVTTIANA